MIRNIRNIVVFERYTESGKAELDFRLMRQALPSGSCPLAIADGTKFNSHTGQHFSAEEVENYARQQSGYFKEG